MKFEVVACKAFAGRGELLSQPAHSQPGKHFRISSDLGRNHVSMHAAARAEFTGV
jgi:hypothetical protein